MGKKRLIHLKAKTINEQESAMKNTFYSKIND